MFSENSLSGKHILVTGGGSGLGLAMARMFAKLGADVSICGRTQATLDLAAEKIKEATGREVKTHTADVRHYEEVGEMIAALGPLNGLVNNAAGNFMCPSEDLSPNGFRSIIDIVLQGTFNCTQQFGKALIERGEPGSVISIVTTYTETGSSFVLPSACAKAGVEALTKTLAWEWSEYSIRLNAIAPGPFPTEGAWKRLVPDENVEKAFKNKHPMRRFGEPVELAELASFLISDHASYINGETITIDGGERLASGQFNFVTQLMPRDQLKGMFAAMKKEHEKA